MDDAKNFAIALEEAKAGFEEGGIPVSLPISLHYYNIHFTAATRLPPHLKDRSLIQPENSR
jgi:hypothetical protein